jgi:hypothetical protein
VKFGSGVWGTVNPVGEVKVVALCRTPAKSCELPLSFDLMCVTSEARRSIFSCNRMVLLRYWHAGVPTVWLGWVRLQSIAPHLYSAPIRFPVMSSEGATTFGTFETSKLYDCQAKLLHELVCRLLGSCTQRNLDAPFKYTEEGRLYLSVGPRAP